MINFLVLEMPDLQTYTGTKAHRNTRSICGLPYKLFLQVSNYPSLTQAGHLGHFRPM